MLKGRDPSCFPWRQSSHPFVITRKGNSRVRKCPGCREEFSSHTVATACDNNQLEEHINCLLKARPDPSLDALASGRLDAGKKKGKKRKRVRKTSPAQAYVSRVL